MYVWSEILNLFSDSPSQRIVAQFLLENGLSVNMEGKISCNGVPLAATQIADRLKVDRRVVDSTAKRIRNSPYANVFLNMRATPDLSLVAESLDLSVIIILPKDATEEGIVDSCVSVLASHKIGIRQIFVTDPHLSEEPRLVIITEQKIPAAIFEELKNLPQIRRLII